LVELGASEPDDNTAAKVVVRLNRLCGRSGAHFEAVMRSLSTLANDAPLLINKLTPPAKAVVESAELSEDEEDDE